MSFYTDAIETVYVNPSFDSSNFRTEFMLPANKVYLPTLRMCGLGYQKTPNADSSRYNYLVGAYGLVKHIRLLDKGIEIDSCKFCSNLQGFKNLNKSPRHNGKVAVHLRNSELGFTHNSVASTTSSNTSIVSNIKSMKLSANTNKGGGADANVYLGEFLPILKSLNVLSTQMFRHLKLIIEYENVKSRVIIDNQDKTYNTAVPVLVIDEVVEKEAQQKLLGAMQSIRWVSYEHDRFDIPANTPGGNAVAEQTVDVKLNGLKNKTIGRVLVVKQLANDNDTSVNANNAIIGFGNVGSIQCVQEKYQLRVNGANILPEQGITKYNEQLALLAQTYGDITMLPFSHCGSIPSGLQGNKLTDKDVNGAKQLGYFGIAVNDFVQDFQLTYKRENNSFASDIANNGQVYTNAHLTGHVYFEVNKMLQLQGGAYRIMYV